MFTHSTAASFHACYYFLLLVAGSHQLSIKEFLVPKYVERGGSAELHCRYALLSNETEVELFVKWWWTPQTNSGDDRQLIYQRIAGQEAQVISHVNSSKLKMESSDTIVLTSVTPADSGTYECEVSNVDELRRHDKLVVYQMGTGPVLNISETQNSTENGEAHTLSIECHALDVAPLPQLTVYIEGNNITVTTILEEHDGVYSIYANATLSAEEMEPSEIQCEMFYADAQIAHPQYVDTVIFVPAGYTVLSTTEAPEDATETAAAPDSLQNSSDDGIGVCSSWLLMATAAILSHLLKLSLNYS